MPSALLNVPHYKQEFHYSCVAACARMVLAHYGVQQTEDWDRPRADRGAWRRQEVVWISPRTGLAHSAIG